MHVAAVIFKNPAKYRPIHQGHVCVSLLIAFDRPMKILKVLYFYHAIKKTYHIQHYVNICRDFISK